MIVRRCSILADGLVFPECPRWHDGRLWFCDMEDRRLCVLSDTGAAETVAVLPCYAAGIGWKSDGDVLVVAMQDQVILCIDSAGVISTHADLRGVAVSHCNDMVVGPDGRAYVGSFGFDIWAEDAPNPGVLMSISATGEPRLEADGLAFPNASVITPDGRTLIVAETFASRLLGFRIADDGSLVERRTWTDLDGFPDGICLDAHGGIWAALPLANRCVRVLEGGEVTDSVTIEGDGAPLAVALGGADRRTLYIVTASPGHTPQDRQANRGGTIRTTRVDIPGAGWP